MHLQTGYLCHSSIPISQDSMAPSTDRFRFLLIISLVLELTKWGCAEPQRVQLNLDGSENKFKHLVNIAIPVNYVHNKLDFPKGKEGFERAGKKILYISGKFEEYEEKEILSWGNGKSAEALAELVCKIFPTADRSDVFVTVVFPESCTETKWGINFIKHFDIAFQHARMNIGIGSPTVKIHLGFERQILENKIEEIKETKNCDKDEFLSSVKQNVFVVYKEDKLEMFSFIEEKWISIEKKQGKYDLQGKVSEANQVTIHIESTCSVEKDKLQVAEHTENYLAPLLISILGEKEHPKQRVKVELECENDHPEKKYEELINALISEINSTDQGIDVYGRLPCVILHIDRNETNKAASYLKMKLNSKDTCTQFAVRQRGDTWHSVDSNEKEKEITDENDTMYAALSQAQELYIELNGHGLSSGTSFEIFTKNPEDLAKTLKELLTNKYIGNSDMKSKRVELTLKACDSGSKMGQKYTVKFLKEINGRDEEGIIDEVIAFNGKGLDMPYENKYVNYHICIANQKKFINKFDTNDYEKYSYISEKDQYNRLICRSKWSNTNKQAFLVAPAAEYDVWSETHE